ncbi:Transcription factor IIA, alpha/beta subunit [Cordyceps fumosorosea ARSEF 2679]|uniref:Transcription initiation factor IIA large subunit n=1 Tax=Cordyceps fumosorosea (strain ARSEF 2679) TaxID=1081104 RepID=A0A167UFL7_CORFA|nr:Transcription factor IIA, alpha/beta subunit [Cordyceps fumosorosea ARSEF 2679]OAA61537.1 Transcription factor IIA, alpha/beta subunit [Cordyceps fumosorosea ARSEF 2679]
MSNQAVGNVYQTIIDEVINSSRVDFEESGVEESVLEELRKGWQQKLSQLDVARFPWDPRPEPTPAVADQQPPQTYVPQPPFPGSAPAAHNGAADGAYIKQEPGVNIKEEPGTQAAAVPQQYPAYAIDSAGSVAANRAAQQLQAQYGMRAAGSINAIQDRMGQGPQQSGQAPQAPAAAASQAQQPNPTPPATGQQVQNNQTDGAGDVEDEGEDFEGVLLRRSDAGTLDELGRVDIDRMLHSRMAARARSMEGGGLMLPLKEATKNKGAVRTSRKGKGVGAYDGGEDDDVEDDEDAINSDLDDPDEDHDEDEVDDEGLGHIMLCMYDKVQRVKNKWKCTLKDGVLTVNGKEYVFHKATGEYEW